MKKTVLFLIAVLYLVSLAVVTFFGSQISVEQFTTYLDTLEITNYDFIDPQGDKWMELTYDATQSYASRFLDYQWTPDQATYPAQVAFSITNDRYTDPQTGETTVYAGVRPNGEVYFQNLTRSRTVTVRIYATDGPSGPRNWDEILVRCTVR